MQLYKASEKKAVSKIIESSHDPLLLNDIINVEVDIISHSFPHYNFLPYEEKNADY